MTGRAEASARWASRLLREVRRADTGAGRLLALLLLPLVAVFLFRVVPALLPMAR